MGERRPGTPANGTEDDRWRPVKMFINKLISDSHLGEHVVVDRNSGIYFLEYTLRDPRAGTGTYPAGVLVIPRCLF